MNKQKLLVAIAVTGMMALSFVLPAEAAWLSGWDKRVKLTIDHNDITANLSNFPILVYLSNSSGRGPDDVSAVFDELTADTDLYLKTPTTRIIPLMWVDLPDLGSYATATVEIWTERFRFNLKGSGEGETVPLVP